MNAAKKNRKKVIIGTLAICLVAALGIGGTMAFLTDSEQVTNHFSMGDLDITIDEPHWYDGETTEPTNPSDPTDPSDPTNPSDPTEPTNPPGDGENLVPGDSRDKDPTIEAVKGDSYMRVVMMIQNKDGSVITDANRLELILQTVRYAANDAIKEGTSYSLDDIKKYTTVNTAAFVKNETKSAAGVYYYEYIANDGIFTQGTKVELFTDIVIPTEWNQEELKVLGEYQIVLQAQAIQSANFDNASDAFAALDGEISATPDATIEKNYGTVDKDSDADYVLAGRTVNP